MLSFNPDQGLIFTVVSFFKLFILNFYLLVLEKFTVRRKFAF